MIKIRYVVMAICFFVLCLCLSGCGERYPEVIIQTSSLADSMIISIGQLYEYDSFEIVESDSEKDLILHFVRKEKKE